MNTIQVIETLCKIIEEALSVIRDEETRRQIKEAYNEAIDNKTESGLLTEE